MLNVLSHNWYQLRGYYYADAYINQIDDTGGPPSWAHLRGDVCVRKAVGQAYFHHSLNHSLTDNLPIKMLSRERSGEHRAHLRGDVCVRKAVGQAHFHHSLNHCLTDNLSKKMLYRERSGEHRKRKRLHALFCLLKRS